MALGQAVAGPSVAHQSLRMRISGLRHSDRPTERDGIPISFGCLHRRDKDLRDL